MQNNAETNVLYECDIWFMFGKIKLFLLHMWNNRILNKVFGESSEPRTERITQNCQLRLKGNCWSGYLI
jgi:hypothetical protein